MENIFGVSGSALRLRKLEAVFNQPPRYGKSLDWSGYTVHDAAAILLRYLQRLPESIIPVEMYQVFQVFWAGGSCFREVLGKEGLAGL